MNRIIAECALVVAALASAPSAFAAHPPSEVELANGCFVIRSQATGGWVTASGDGYAAGASRAAATPFFLKPSDIGTYLPHDAGSRLPGARPGGRVGRSAAPGPATEWILPTTGKRFAIESALSGRRVSVSATGVLVLARPGSSGPGSRFALVPATGCAPFPEAELGARGRFGPARDGDGNVLGFVDMHLHISANDRAGGAVIYGEPFHRFGIGAALGHDERVHGPEGAFDVTGNLLRSGLPVGTHDTNGWPSFSGWPVHDTNTHQQTYYLWLKRAWKAGERLVVAQAVEDRQLCEIEVFKAHPCNETLSIALQVRRLRALERYVDAQAGGEGRGWFRLVYGPAQARRVIERGKLAVLIGAESSGLFGCTEFLGAPECNRRDIDRGIAHFKRLGIRSLFPIHWFDNAFGGAAVEGGDKGTFINAMNALETGHFLRTGPCPQPGQGEEMDPFSLPDLGRLSSLYPRLRALFSLGLPVYPPGRQCNVKGLTGLGEYLIRRLIEEGMLIEVDHMSERARLRVLEIAEELGHPLVSSHTHTGGHWTESDLDRLYALGGLAAATPAEAPELADDLLELHRHGDVGLGTDTGGFASAPGPRRDAAASPLAYPFRLGGVEFERQRSGRRTFDLNRDGVAHYGLYPDLIADIRRGEGDAALVPLYRSAEAYLRMWELAVR